MNKINWTTFNKILLKDNIIYYMEDLEKENVKEWGIKRDSKLKALIKKVFWPLLKTRANLLVDGFIRREIVKLIDKYINDKTVFLDIGCGDMSLAKYIPHNVYYNALDLIFTEFHLKRLFNRNQNINLVIASATKIPVESNAVSLIVSAETFEHIKNVDKVMKEIKRISVHNAILICSIPNNYCYKYNKKGPHPDHINSWTFDGFKKIMESYGFELVECFMKGIWIPLPPWITNTSYQIPLSLKNEYLNTNFFYVFRLTK